MTSKEIVVEAGSFKCPECGASVPEAASRCPGCGAEFEIEEIELMECPRCGNRAPADAEECPICDLVFRDRPAKKQESADRRQGGEQAALLAKVREVRSLMQEAERFQGRTMEARVWVEKAVQKAERGKWEEAIEMLSKAAGVLRDSIRTRAFEELDVIHTMAAKSTHKSCRDSEAEMRRLIGGKDYRKALDWSTRCADSMNDEQRTRAEALRSLRFLDKTMVDAEIVYADLRAARIYRRDAREAAARGEWSYCQGLARAGLDAIKRSVPDALRARLRETAKSMEDWHSAGRNVDLAARLLRQTMELNAKGDGPGALESFYELKAEMRTLGTQQA
jgi:DNA-directed RNA polymerase subunit RPC12/RpoP